MRKTIFLASLFFAAAAFAQSYDTVLQGGRVMDPETGLDAVRNVGISQGRIARISAEALTGKRVLDAKASSTCISTARMLRAAASRPSTASPPLWKWKSVRRTWPHSCRRRTAAR